MRLKNIVISVIALSLVSAALYWRLQSSPTIDDGTQNSAAARSNTKSVNGGSSRKKSSITELTKVRVINAPIGLEALGQITSNHSAAVRPQQSGILTRVLFQEGQNVKAGQTLFEIDAAPYIAAVNQIKAQIERDRTAANAAETQAARLKSLLVEGFVSQQETDTAAATAKQARAQVQMTESLLASAQINLSRTKITAPISGRTGSISVKSGNLVNANDATPLVVINQLQPIAAEFSIPQSQLASVISASKNKKKVAVSARIANQIEPALGTLQFIDNTVDHASGTVKLKAIFANKNEQLWPGTIANLTLTLGEQANAIVIPDSAILQSSTGTYVFVIDADNIAHQQNVEIERQLDEDVIISKGLLGNETIVARAPRDLKEGSLVQSPEQAKAMMLEKSDPTNSSTQKQGHHNLAPDAQK